MAGTYKVNGDKLTGLTVYSTLPVGTVIASFTNSEVGFLPCDHSEYNQSDFPELYAKLQNIEQCQSENEGKFYVPDLRESNLVGVGTSENEDIASHDTYVVGEFKDDQLQGHKHYLRYFNGSVAGNSNSGTLIREDYQASQNTNEGTSQIGNPITDGTNGDPRTGSTTHGKQTGVYYLIKAVDYASLPQNAIDDTVTTTGNAWSASKTSEEIADAKKVNYSTEEKVIGTWIDGNPIYRKIFIDPNNSWSATDNIIGNITDFKEPVTLKAIACYSSLPGWVENNEGGSSRCYAYIKSNGEVHFYRADVLDGSSYPKKVIIEYTKTTD